MTLQAGGVCASCPSEVGGSAGWWCTVGVCNVGVPPQGCDRMDVTSWCLTREMLNNGVCKGLRLWGESLNANLLRGVCTCIQARQLTHSITAVVRGEIET